MKKLTLIACAVFLLAACNDSKTGKKPAMKTAKDSFSYAFGAYSGSMLHNFKIKDIEWVFDEYSKFTKIRVYLEED